ncbi:MAG: glycosyltransferase family 9 protein [Candidatus Aminicenantaceae bacterium]
MNIAFMRIVDRWVGIPLCFLLTCVHTLGRWFRPSRSASPPQKILFVEISEMGSMVLAYPLFRKTMDLFPRAELYFLTFQQNRHAVDILDVVPEENVFTIDGEHPIRFASSTVKVLRALRKQKLDVILDMELFARFSAAASWLIGARARVGFHRFHNEGLYRGNLLSHRVEYNPHIHMAYNLLNLILALTRPAGERPHVKLPIEPGSLPIPAYTVPEADKTLLWEKIAALAPENPAGKCIILLNPNASDLIPLRRWPLNNYISLAQRLLESPDRLVLLTGTQAEHARAEQLTEAVGSSRCLNFTGQTTFAQLLALYSIADVLVTNDSGPVHFSTLTRTRTLALFGPETPDLYGPLGTDCRVVYARYACSPCVSAFNHRRSPCSDNRCLQAITVDQVMEDIKILLLP